MSAIADHFTGNASEQGAYLGLPLVAVLIYIMIRWRGEYLVRWAGGAAAAMAVLSMGSYLHVGGHTHVTVGRALIQIPLPWKVLDAVPIIGNALPGRLMLFVWLLAGILIAFFLDRLQSSPATRGRLLASAVAVVALLPLVPRPYPHTPNPVPSFFVDQWAQYVPDTTVALVAPLAAEWWKGGSTSALLMQAETGMRFQMPEAYALLPPRSGSTSFSAPPSILKDVMMLIQSGDYVPPLTQDLRLRLYEDLRRWHVQTIVVAPMLSEQWTGFPNFAAAPNPNYEPEMIALFSDLLGREPLSTGGVYVWRDVQDEFATATASSAAPTNQIVSLGDRSR
jgi:hypothetical protein